LERPYSGNFHNQSTEFQVPSRFRSELKQDVQRGPYKSVDEFVEQSVSMLHEQEAWLAANRAEIQTKIAESYASAQRGELIGPDEVRAKLAELKRARPNR
jgi:Arc/MetJ-type ribon-helix-helix transcriptional regulator